MNDEQTPAEVHQSALIRALFGFMVVVGAFIAASLTPLIAVVIGAIFNHTYDLDKLTSFDNGWNLLLFALGEAGLIGAALLTQKIWPFISAGLKTSWAQAKASLMQVALLAVVIVGMPLATLSHDGKLTKDAPDDVLLIVGIIALSFLIGFAEEYLFRGVLIDVLGGRRAIGISVTVSALLFGAVHLLAANDDNLTNELFNAIAVTFAFGVPFALVRLRSGSIVGPIALHGLNDSFALVVYGGRELPDVSRSEHIASVVTSMAMAGAYIAWFIWAERRLHPPQVKDSSST